MNSSDFVFYRRFTVCISVFVLGIAVATQAQQEETNNVALPKEKVRQSESNDIATQVQAQETNDVTLLKEMVRQLKSKVKIQEDIIRRASARINTLENQLTEQTKRNNNIGTTPARPPEEDSIVNLDSKGSNQTDDSKDTLRVKRAIKKIDDMNDAIELVEHRINNLPPIWLPDRHSDYDFAFWITNILKLKLMHLSHADQDYPRRMKETLDTVHELIKLLYEVENNYRYILQYGQKQSDLGVDVKNAKKKLIEYEGKIDVAKSLLEFLRLDVRENRDRFNIMPG